MAEEPVSIIRETTRNLLKLNRRLHKDEQTDSHRSIQETRITKETIVDIANKLKTKTSISTSDLQTLKNGLIDDSTNIEVILNTHGALRGIIRELTGHNVKNQCAAAGCCCNLALGDSRACMSLAKAAGSYLTAALDNLTTELAVTCAWTLGNLAGANTKVCDVLISQGALSKLSEYNVNVDFQDAALYALVHFVYQLKDDLSSDHLTKILQTVSKLEITMESSKLLSILSCHKDFSENISEKLLQKILEDLQISIKYHIEMCSQNKICCRLVYLLRSLANMDKMYDHILKYFTFHNMSVSFKSLLNTNKCVSETCLWLLGNLFNFCDDKQFFGVLTS